MGECVRDCEKCDVCGFEWIKGPKPPERCHSQKCRSSLWNRGRKSHKGRPDKGMVRVKQRMSPTLDTEGKHHILCPCLLCLTAIGQDKPKPGAPRGITHGGKCVREGKWKLPTAPRHQVEARGLKEALLRGVEGEGVSASDVTDSGAHAANHSALRCP